MKHVDDVRRQLQEQQVHIHPRERGSPKALQDLARSCILKQIHIIMKALRNQHEYL